MSLISQVFGTRRRGVAEKGEVQLIVETRHCLVSTALMLFSLKLKQKTNATFELNPSRRTPIVEILQLRNQVETPNLGVSTALFSHSPLTKPPQSHFAPTTHHQKNKDRNESA